MSIEPLSDKRLQILAAAELIISESGLHGLSMQKVAKQAQVAAGTIYRYFDDKEHLISELRLHVTERVATAVQAGVDDSLTLKEQYRTMYLNIWGLASNNTKMLRNRLQYESSPLGESAAYREQERIMFATIDRMFNTGKEQGIFKPLDNEVLSALSLETSVTLARKHAFRYYQLDEAALDSAIEASWDAIITH